MNRVRIVAVAAASLGVAVVAGTLLQGPAESPAAGSPSVVAPVNVESPAGTSLASLADTAPSDPAPQVTGASILPGAFEIGAAGRDALAQSLPSDTEAPGAPLWLAPPEAALATATAGELAQAPTAEPMPGESASGFDVTEALIDEPDPCAVWLAVVPQPGAAIEVSLFAPCDGGAVVGLAHGGLRFDASLDAEGQLLLTMPALAVLASVEVAFADGRRHSDSAVVGDAAIHDRVAIQWEGPAVLGLNAYEFGAGYGESGHVGPERRGAPGAADHGYLTVLGDPTLEAPRLAQVYSFPSGLAREAGEVELELEAAITDASCGQTLVVEALELRAAASPVLRSIRLDMPSCDGTGGFLLLRNFLPDLDIALR